MISIRPQDALAIAKSVRGFFSEGQYEVFAIEAATRHRFSLAAEKALADAIAYLRAAKAELKGDSGLAEHAFLLQWFAAFAAKDKHTLPLADGLGRVAEELLALLTGAPIKVDNNRFMKERTPTAEEASMLAEVMRLRVAAFAKATEALLAPERDAGDAISKIGLKPLRSSKDVAG